MRRAETHRARRLRQWVWAATMGLGNAGLPG